MGIPLGPAVRILAYGSGSDSSQHSMHPLGHEGIHWSRTPCVPPYCWHRCEPRPKLNEKQLTEEEGPLWRPEQRRCPIGLSSNGSTEHGFIFPLSIGIPSGRVVGCVPTKTQNLANGISLSDRPRQAKRNGHKAWGAAYEFGPQEEHAYNHAYQTARFALTRKKSGWDCMRHYEILAAGAVPLFSDLDSAPSGK